jgi:hypothetical protein
LHLGSRDKHTLVREGFFGHNVSQAGIGWILGELPASRRGNAFGHDCWEFDPGRIQPPAGRPCASFPDHAASYAASRFNALRRELSNRQKVAAGQELQLMAAGYKAFVSSRYNCVHDDWESALADQKSYASFVSAQHVSSSPSAADCSIYGSMYNQVQVSWNSSQIKALFYVNDTLTPQQFISRHRSVRAEVRASLERSSMEASNRALALARLAQHIIASTHHMTVPIVQYVHTEECSRPAQFVVRQQAHDKHPGIYRASARAIFKAVG